jgi:hypothetical protein
MTNRIQNIRITDTRLDPAEADLFVSVLPERLTSLTQVRGRLVGPRCPYATTVEVAYPLREHSREYESTGTPSLLLRVVIPEASFWDPESPFLYQGPVELWQDGQRCDQVQVSHGLRALGLASDGLRCNGRRLSLRGVARGVSSEAEARSLHRAGFNTLLAPAGTDPTCWDLADRFGFLVLTRITNEAELGAEVQRAPAFGAHACCLGWVVTPEAVAGEVARVVAQMLPGRDGRTSLLGMELQQVPAEPLPDEVSFVVCAEALVPALAAVPLPRVIRHDGPGEAPAAARGVLGWIGTA